MAAGATAPEAEHLLSVTPISPLRKRGVEQRFGSLPAKLVRHSNPNALERRFQADTAIPRNSVHGLRAGGRKSAARLP